MCIKRHYHNLIFQGYKGCPLCSRAFLPGKCEPDAVQLDQEGRRQAAEGFYERVSVFMEESALEASQREARVSSPL